MIFPLLEKCPQKNYFDIIPAESDFCLMCMERRLEVRKKYRTIENHQMQNQQPQHWRQRYQNHSTDCHVWSRWGRLQSFPPSLPSLHQWKMQNAPIVTSVLSQLVWTWTRWALCTVCSVSWSIAVLGRRAATQCKMGSYITKKSWVQRSGCRKYDLLPLYRWADPHWCSNSVGKDEFPSWVVHVHAHAIASLHKVT